MNLQNMAAMQNKKDRQAEVHDGRTEHMISRCAPDDATGHMMQGMSAMMQNCPMMGSGGQTAARVILSQVAFQSLYGPPFVLLLFAVVFYL
jgi:hypothetical protein